jgi:hypothetical protein
VLCAAVSGRMHFRWRRMDEYDQSRVWKHYGWFSALMCLGGCTGALSFAFWAEWLRSLYNSDFWTPDDMLDGNERFKIAQTSYAVVSCRDAC